MMTEKPDAPDFGEFELMEALASADVLITDYSSIIFEYSLLSHPMLFYVPDMDSYVEERGFYYGYEDFVPGKYAERYKMCARRLKKRISMRRLCACLKLSSLTVLTDTRQSELRSLY